MKKSLFYLAAVVLLMAGVASCDPEEDIIDNPRDTIQTTSQTESYTGVLRQTSNPAETEPVVPGLVWALDVDSNVYRLEYEGHLIWAEDSILGVTHSVGDTVTYNGTLQTRRDVNDSSYTVLAIVQGE
jgi:hypothetical protein